MPGWPSGLTPCSASMSTSLKLGCGQTATFQPYCGVRRSLPRKGPHLYSCLDWATCCLEAGLCATPETCHAFKHVKIPSAFSCCLWQLAQSVWICQELCSKTNRYDCCESPRQALHHHHKATAEVVRNWPWELLGETLRTNLMWWKKWEINLSRNNMCTIYCCPPKLQQRVWSMGLFEFDLCADLTDESLAEEDNNSSTNWLNANGQIWN